MQRNAIANIRRNGQIKLDYDARNSPITECSWSTVEPSVCTLLNSQGNAINCHKLQYTARNSKK